MSSAPAGVERTSARHVPGPLFIGVLALSLALGSLIGSVTTAAASTTTATYHRPKVVVVVGATESTTPRYRSIARGLARQARSYGANVIEVYSPFATWARVRRAARGANLLIYLGHGNGWPSKYAPFQTRTKDGMGLNAAAIGSDYNTEYYGEQYLDSGLHLARNSVVLLVHLCYASGAAEWGSPSPSLSVAKRRVDNYGAGFLRTGARAVIAEGLGHAGYVLRGLFKSRKSLRQIFWSSHLATGKYTVAFNPKRSPSWAGAILDPQTRHSYYRSIIGDLNMTATTWR
jgi:hypothetical protein